MQATAMYINDYDTARLGLIVRRVEGRDDALSARDRTTGIAKRLGEVPLARDFETAARVITIIGTIKTTSMATTLAARDELKGRLFSGVTEVRFSDKPDRMYLVKPTDARIVGTAPQFDNPFSEVTISLICHDPLAYDKLCTAIGFNSVLQPCPLGTAPSQPTIRIAGPVTNPVITYRDVRGVVKRTMGFTVTLLATEYLDIDCELMAISRYTAGAKANGIALLTSGDFIMLDPQDADPWNSAWPTLEVSPAASAEALYRKAYL